VNQTKLFTLYSDGNNRRLEVVGVRYWMECVYYWRDVQVM